jgi:GDP-L-fucose synthase
MVRNRQNIWNNGLSAYRRQHHRHYISVMPCNLYGPHDNFNLETSHVLPALIRKFNEAKIAGAKEIVILGTGTPLREFLHVDDLAKGVVFCLDNYDECEHINRGAVRSTQLKQSLSIWRR